MSVATFRFHGVLGHFLPSEQREVPISHTYARAATLKQAIEALGVPHTEIGRLTVNSAPATLGRAVRQGDVVEAWPHGPGEAPYQPPLLFLADAHLGGLARMLRMLGFDAVYDNALHDLQIAEQASIERRVVLTRDRELLKRREVLRGCYVRALKPEAQLQELARRYPIAALMRPFTLCLHCNLPLSPAAPEAVAANVPERIGQRYQRFMHCPGCARIYWEGSHWERMRSVLAAVLEVPVSDMG
jgi:uncharacterized protein with PIN domain